MTILNLSRIGWMLLTLVAALVLGLNPSSAACPVVRTATEIRVAFTNDSQVRAGEPVTVRWSSTRTDDASCRAPLFLVLATPARVRFAGEGFLAMPPGGKGPYEIAERINETRVFIPLHAMPVKASGSFKVKFYTAGENKIDWLVVGLTSGQAPESSTVISTAKAPLVIPVESGKPAIVVRDFLAPFIANDGTNIERPKKTIISNSNEFELQIFDKFYRVRDVATGS